MFTTRHAAALGLVALAACSTDSSPTKVNTPRTAGSPSAVRAADRLAELKPGLPERASLALQRSKWVGDLHHEAMQDLIRNRKAWIGDKPTTATKCRGLQRLGLKYAAKAYAHAGVSRSEAEMRRDIDAAVAATALCRGTAMSTMWLRNAPLVPHLAFARAAQSEEEATGAFLQYNDLMPGTVNGAYYPSEVANNVGFVMSSASGIPSADLEVVAASGSTSVSSSDEWYYYYSSGGGGGGGGGGGSGGTEFMSLFNRSSRIPLWGIVAGADILGCIAGAGSSWLGGERRKMYLAAQCWIWGAASSGATHLGLL